MSEAPDITDKLKLYCINRIAAFMYKAYVSAKHIAITRYCKGDFDVLTIIAERVPEGRAIDRYLEINGTLTDLNKFVSLYASFGIECKITEYIDGKKRITFVEDSWSGTGKTSDDITTTSNKFEGYYGFYSVIDFDENGKFVSQGFYE